VRATLTVLQGHIAKIMNGSWTKLVLLMLSGLFVLSGPGLTIKGNSPQGQDPEFGPVVSAYLGYLRNEQEVVDDRVSRREISAAYYRRNSNRIRALRQMAIRLARESGNDYLPELEAVVQSEMGTLFEHPPPPASLHVGEVLNTTFRFLGTVRSGEVFFVFARLDIYEQAELKQQKNQQATAAGASGAVSSPTAESTTETGDRKTATRSRRVSQP
jgi:hypothetical protein